MGGTHSLVGDDANAFLQYVSNNTDSGVDPRLCVLGIDDVEEVATVAGASFAGTATKDPELMEAIFRINKWPAWDYDKHGEPWFLMTKALYGHPLARDFWGWEFRKQIEEIGW